MIDYLSGVINKRYELLTTFIYNKILYIYQGKFEGFNHEIEKKDLVSLRVLIDKLIIDIERKEK